MFQIYRKMKLQIYPTNKNSVHLVARCFRFIVHRFIVQTKLQIYRTDEVTDLSYRQKQCIPPRRYRFIVQTETGCACTLQIYRTDQMPFYRTGKNSVHLQCASAWHYWLIVQVKSACACTTKQIYRTDKNNVHLHYVTVLLYRQKQCIPARLYRFIVQTKTIYTCMTLQIDRTDKNNIYLHYVTVLLYR